MQTVAPTPAGSAAQGPMNVAEAANALAGILPEEGQEDSGEAQLPEEGTAADEELSTEADAVDNETDAEQSEEDDYSEEEEQPQVFTVKVDGKEVDVTLEELQKGYSRLRITHAKRSKLPRCESTLRQSCRQCVPSVSNTLNY